MLINLERARGLMKDYGIDVMIATTPENVWYCADYAPWLFKTYRGNTPKKGVQSYVVIPRDPEIPPALIPAGIGYNTYVYLAQFPSWIEDLYPFFVPGTWPGKIPDVPKYSEPDTPRELIRLRELTEKYKSRVCDSPGEALVKALKDRGYEGETVALESFGMSPVAREYLGKELPNLKMKEAAEFLRLIRAVKTPKELYYIRRAAEINEKAFQHLLTKITPGVTTQDLVNEHNTVVSSEGAMPTFMNISATAHPAVMWEPYDYILQPGDVIWADGGCSFHHYHADTGLSCVLGEPTSKMKENFAAVEDCMEAARSAFRPGASSSSVQAAMFKVMNKRGWSNPMVFGHGVGVEEREHPLMLGQYKDFKDDEILSGSSDLVLETNMVACLELTIWEWGVGGIKAEQTCVVTPTGCKTICRQDRVLTVKR